MSSSTDCKPCKDKHKQVIATMWCRECEIPLCSTCENAHKKNQIFKYHQVLNLKFMPSVDRSSIFCKEHGQIAAQQLCVSHDALCCRSCADSKHNKCKSLITIASASKTFHTAGHLSAISKSLNSILNVTKTVKKNHEKNIQEIKQSETQMKKDIADAKRRLIDQINKVEKDLISDLNKRKEEIFNEIKSLSEMIGKMESSAKETLEKIEVIKDNGSDNQAFLLCRKIQTDVKSMEQNLVDIVAHCRRYNISFESNSPPIESLGKINVQMDKAEIPFPVHSNSHTPITKRHKKQICTAQLKYKFDIWPKGKVYGIAVTSSDHLLICNSDARMLMKCEFDGKVLQQYTMRHAPNKVAVIPNSDMAVVTLPDVSEMDFVTVKSLGSVKTVKLPGIGKGISASSEKIVVGGEMCLYIFDKNGQYLQNIKVKGNFSFPLQYVHICEDGTILFTDTYNAYRVSHGHQRTLHCGSIELKTPQGITTDKQKRIYIADRDTNSVVRFSNEGVYQDTLLTEKDDIKRPWAVSFNQSFDSLIISNKNGESIYVYSFSSS